MGLMKKLMSALVAASLVLGLVGTASAGILDNPEFGLERMHELELVKGRTNEDGTVDLAPNDPITRAELVTIFVRAFGKEDLAALVQDANVFPDTVGHWANGYVAIAKQMMEQNGYPLGLPDGNFDPDGQVTAAQAVAFLMKFMGVAPDTTQSWPMDYVQGALNAGLITEQDYADIEPILNTPTPATRALVFYLADQAFYNFPHGDGTVYTTYVDTDAPTLTVDELAATTTDAAVTVTGSTDGVSVLVNDTEVEIDADGNFAADVELALGENEIVIAAFDRVGNMTPAEMVITRTTGAAVAIEAEDIIVAAGDQVELEAAVVDANGNVIEDAEILVEGDAGSLEGAIYTAPETAGEYTLNLSYEDLTATIDVTVVAGPIANVVADVESASPNSKVQLIATDAYGNEIEGAEFAVDADANALVDPTTGIFVAFEAGNYTVTATKDGVTATGTVAVFGDVAGLKITAPESMVANGATEYTITVAAVDENGNVVTSFEEEIDLVTPLDSGDYDVTAEDGVATFTVTAPGGLVNSEVDITAEYGDFSETVMADVIAQVATSLKVDLPEYMAVNGTGVEGTVQVLDQNGEPMITGESWEVTLKVSGSGYLNAADETEATVYADGDGTTFDVLPIDATQTGTVTVTATYTGLETAQDTLNAVYAFDASKFTLTQVTEEAVAAAGEGVYVLKIEVTDKNGVPVALAAQTNVTLTFDTDTPAELDVAVDAASNTYYYTDAGDNNVPVGALNADGEYSFLMPAVQTYYVFVAAEKLTGDVTVTLQDDAANFAAVSSKVSFKAGAPFTAEFERNALNVLASDTTTLTAQLYDDAGNKVAKAGVPVKFYADPGEESYVKLNGKAEAYVTETDENGQATVDVNLLAYDFDFNVNVDVDVDEDESWEGADFATLTIVPAITDSITVYTYGWGNGDYVRKSRFEAGETIYLRAYLKDNNGIAMTDIDDTAIDTRLVTEGVEFGEDVVEAAVDWSLAAGETYYQGELTAAKMGSYTITVSDDTIAKDVSGSRSISIVSGAPHTLAIAEDPELTAGEVKAFTVQVVDEYGNVVSPSKVNGKVDFTVDFVADAGDYADVRAAANGGTTTDFTIEATRNATTIYLVSNDTDGPTLTITITNLDIDGDGTNDLVQPASVDFSVAE